MWLDECQECLDACIALCTLLSIGTSVIQLAFVDVCRRAASLQGI